jgi:hypothetical protein
MFGRVPIAWLCARNEQAEERLNFSHPFTFGRQALMVCSTAEFSLQNVHFHKSRRNSQ